MCVRLSLSVLGLMKFGNSFLTSFEGSALDAPILKNITLVDTPGERVQRRSLRQLFFVI